LGNTEKIPQNFKFLQDVLNEWATWSWQ
jgi:hypothetical protein